VLAGYQYMSRSVKTSPKESYFEISTGANLDASRRPQLEKCCMLDWSVEFPAGDLETANVNIK